MNDDLIQDLKQFIASAISQQTSDIRGDISDIRGDISDIRGDISDIRGDISDIRGDIKRLDNKIDDLSESVALAIQANNDDASEQLINHEARITKLEAKTV